MLPGVDSAGGRLVDWPRPHCAGRTEDFAEMRVGELDPTLYRDCMRDEDTGCLLARGAHLSPFLLDVEARPGHQRFLDLETFLAMKIGAAARCLERISRRRVVQLGIPYVLYGLAVANCPPLACCLISAIEPLLNPLWVFLFDGEAPGIASLVGGVIVILTIPIWSIRSSRSGAQAEG